MIPYGGFPRRAPAGARFPPVPRRSRRSPWPPGGWQVVLLPLGTLPDPTDDPHMGWVRCDLHSDHSGVYTHMYWALCPNITCLEFEYQWLPAGPMRMSP